MKGQPPGQNGGGEVSLGEGMKRAVGAAAGTLGWLLVLMAVGIGEQSGFGEGKDAGTPRMGCRVRCCR